MAPRVSLLLRAGAAGPGSGRDASVVGLDDATPDPGGLLPRACRRRDQIRCLPLRSSHSASFVDRIGPRRHLELQARPALSRSHRSRSGGVGSWSQPASRSSTGAWSASTTTSTSGWGAMSDVGFAAYDPLFWSHHAMVDRLWRICQHRNPGALPPAHVLETPLQVGRQPMTVRQTLNVKQLGYEYAGSAASVRGTR